VNLVLVRDKSGFTFVGSGWLVARVRQMTSWPFVHAPNTVGNFCFEVTLGYRRLERGR
jgi:hypothetical protein